MTDEYSDARRLLRERDSTRTDSRRRDLRDDAIRECLPLADHIARRYRGRGENLEDLRQTARLGLVKAIDRFDSRNGADLLAFLVPSVMGEVRRYFRDRSARIRVPRRERLVNRRLQEAEEILAQRFGRVPTRHELADEIGDTVEHVDEARRAARTLAPVSLDESTADPDGEGTPLLDRVGEPDEGYAHVDDIGQLRPALEALPERERRIVGLRFFELKSQQEIAEDMGLSQMHVSRLLRRSLATLRSRLDDPV